MSKIFELHDLVINSESRTVRKGGETLKLHDLTYELLLGLVSSAPEPLNLDSLAERVWKAPHPSRHPETAALCPYPIRITIITSVLQ